MDGTSVLVPRRWILCCGLGLACLVHVCIRLSDGVARGGPVDEGLRVALAAGNKERAPNSDRDLVLLAGFERSTDGWEPGRPASYPDAKGAVGGNRSRDKASGGTYSYEMRIDRSRGDAVFQVQPDYPFDLSDYSGLMLDAYTDTPASIGVAICTGVSWTWHEAHPREVAQGWNRLVLDLKAPAYRSGASGQYAYDISNLQLVPRLAVKIYGPMQRYGIDPARPKSPEAVSGARDLVCSLYLDNVRLIRAPKNQSRN